MSDITIEVCHVWKKFRRGEIHDSLRDLVPVLAHRLVNRGRKRCELGARDFWALNDISFHVRRGEVLGIIGSNGAGKSTMLKILCRILHPNKGHVRLNGRFSALIEVGAGFHPDLTGRENIYLNGSILGMRKCDIDRKLDQIIDFSGIEPFIDTPVKRYSSGMHARLGFAVAAHMDPEILIVDEVLSVGDAAFQKKCLVKMGDVATEGRTVLFVSHNMHAISLLCHSTILLKNGRVIARGPTAQVLEQYLSSGSNRSAEALWPFEEAPGTSIAKLHSVRALNEKEVCFDMWMNKSITLQARFWILRQARVEVSFHVYNQHRLLLFATGNFHDPKWRGIQHEPGLYTCSCTIPKHFLNDGAHYVKVYLHHDNPHQVDVQIPDVISFNVHDPGDTRGDWIGTWIGLVRPILPWRGERIGDLP